MECFWLLIAGVDFLHLVGSANLINVLTVLVGYGQQYETARPICFSARSGPHELVYKSEVK